MLNYKSLTRIIKKNERIYKRKANNIIFQLNTSIFEVLKSYCLQTMNVKVVLNGNFKLPKSHSNILCFTICLSLLLVVNNTGFSNNLGRIEPVIKLSDIKEGVNLNKHLMLYKDKSKQLGINEIVNKEFTPNNNSAISLGYNNDADWIKFSVYSDHFIKEKAILNIDKLLIDSISLYFFNRYLNKWDSIQGGACVPLHKKPMIGFGTYFPIRIHPNDTTTFYLRCSSYSGKSFSVSIINPRVLHHTDMNIASYIGIFIGILLCITLYNLFIGFSIKDNLYLHYALANLFSLLAGLANKGFFVYYFSRGVEHFIPYLTTASIGLWILFSSNFNIRILNLRKHSRFAYYLMLGTAIFALLGNLGLNFFRLIGKPHHYSFVAISSLIFCLAAFIAGVIALKKGSRYGRYYLLGWTAVIIGVLLHSLVLLGYFPKNDFTSNFYVIGSALEVLLLSFALADRYNLIQKENNKLELELQYKNTDLTKVVSDNKIRHSLKINLLNELNDIYQDNNGSIKQKLGSFITNLNIQVDADKKRNQLQENIDKINTEFEKNLKERFPNLTQSEVEICGYLKLNLSIKEIANLKRTTEAAVKMAKYRMNKKMMEEGSSVNEVLIEI